MTPLPLALRAMRLAFGLGGRLAPGLAARQAERLFASPRRHQTPAREQAWLADAAPLELASPSGPLFGYRWGRTGRPVLLAHGWEGRASQLGAFVAPLRQAGFRVLAFDARAHGSSPGRRITAPEASDGFAAIAAWLDEPLAGLIAHSLGGNAAAVALAEGALKLERAVLIGTAASLPRGRDRFADILGLPPPVRARLQARIEQRLGPDVWQRYSALERAGELRAPALIIHDVEDRDIPIEEGRALAEAWPGARFHETRGLGHRRILRDPKVIDHAVAFLKDP